MHLSSHFIDLSSSIVAASAPHQTSILTDFAWIMVAAAAAALVFQRLNMPAMIGYLAAGLALGPHLGILHLVSGLDNVQALSELGVIFLMFYIGLEFDFDQLKKLFAPSFAALALQTALMLFIGMQTSVILGFSPVAGWFLGGTLSISSSMVSIKMLREQNALKRPHAQLAVGILVLEDILAMLLLVLLAGIAASGSMDWSATGNSALLISIFVVAVFFIGKLSAPKFIKAIETFGTTEAITLSTVGLIFGVSLLAEHFEFSFALGGFLAGAILSRSRLAERIEHLTEPLRDLFSALFFVSVGMLVDPSSLMDNAIIIGVLSAILILGKFSSCWLGLFLAGNSPEQAAKASLVKSQIGEFSFVIIAIGAQTQTLNPQLQAVASGVAFTTILLTPFLNRNADTVINGIGRICPPSLVEFSDFYQRWHSAIRISLSRNAFLKLASKPMLRLAIHFLLINGIVITAALVSELVPPPEFLDIETSVFQQCIFVFSLLLCVPLIVDTIRNLNVLMLLFTDSALSGPNFQKFSSGPLRAVFNALILFLIFVVYGSLFLAVAAPYFPTGTAFIAFIAISGIASWALWKKLVRLHHNWESAFLRSMQTETQERITKRISDGLNKIDTRNRWDLKVESTKLPEESRWAGKSIIEIDLRKKCGALVAGIERLGLDLTIITPQTYLFPQDRIFLLGEPDQIQRATKILEESISPEETQKERPYPFSFDRTVVPPLCPLDGLSLRDTEIREKYRVTIVGIQRENERITSPGPDDLILEGDILLLMGCKGDITVFAKDLNENTFALPVAAADQ